MKSNSTKIKKQVAKRTSVSEISEKKKVRKTKEVIDNNTPSPKKEESTPKNYTISGVEFKYSPQINDFTKCFEEQKFLDMFFEFSGIHWRICRSEDFESEAADKIKSVNFTGSQSFYIPLNIRGRNYSLFFLSDTELEVVRFLTKSKRLSAFNF